MFEVANWESGFAEIKMVRIALIFCDVQSVACKLLFAALLILAILRVFIRCVRWLKTVQPESYIIPLIKRARQAYQKKLKLI